MIQQYFELQKQIYKLFGYTGGAMMLCDSTGYNWIEHNDRIFSSPDEMTPEVIETGASLFDAYIDTQWGATGYTMVCSDPQVNIGFVLNIYDNTKKIENPTDAQLEALECW